MKKKNIFFKFKRFDSFANLSILRRHLASFWNNCFRAFDSHSSQITTHLNIFFLSFFSFIALSYFRHSLHHIIICKKYVFRLEKKGRINSIWIPFLQYFSSQGWNVKYFLSRIQKKCKFTLANKTITSMMSKLFLDFFLKNNLQF